MEKTKFAGKSGRTTRNAGGLVRGLKMNILKEMIFLTNFSNIK